VVKSCKRKGSLDIDIQDEVPNDIVLTLWSPSIDYFLIWKVPNDIVALISKKSSIKKIVFCDGVGSAKLFLKHHKHWLKGQAPPRIQFKLPSASEAYGMCHKAFGKVLSRLPLTMHASGQREIELVVPYSVSPAAAGTGYEDKRDFYLGYVFEHPAAGAT